MGETKIYQEILKIKELRKQGTGYPEIRKKLTNKGFSEEEIKTIIRKVDDDELRNVKRKGEREKAFENMIYSGGVMLFGFAITAYTYYNAMLSGGVYLIAFGPVIGGYIWFRGEWKKYNSLKD